MIRSQTLSFSQEEALAIFCFRENNPASVLKEKLEMLDKENHDLLLNDIRSIIIVVKIYLNYKSEEVREVIQGLCFRFISDIYKNEETLIPFSDLKFLIPIILGYRNIEQYNMMKTLKIGNNLIVLVRMNLLKLKAIKSFQPELF